MASLLSFIAILLTLSYVEATRVFNQPSQVLKAPVATWILVNGVSGSLAIPVLLAASVKRRKDGLEGPTTPGDRHILSSRDTYAIPVSVALGFILLSIVLTVRQTPLVRWLVESLPTFCLSDTNRAVERHPLVRWKLVSPL